MASADFEEGGMIIQDKLAEAVNSRLAQRIDDAVDIDGEPNPAGVVAAALDQLGFVAKGVD